MSTSTIIKVFITSVKTIGFEIKTIPNGKMSECQCKSSTVGSERWKAGEFDAYKDKIYIKTRELLTTIHLETEKHF
jgi:hypothetical protein